MLFVSTCLCFAHFGLAQDLETKKGAFEFGLQHSINFTSLVGDYGAITYGNREEKYTPVRNRTTFDLGLFANSYLSNSLSLQFEVYYTFMGAHLQKTTSIYHELGKFEGKESESFAMDYIRLPITLNYYPSDKAFIQFGGYVASLLSSEKFYPWEYDKTRKTLEGVNRFDAGLMGGIGLDTKVVKLSFRYTYGLQDVFDKDENNNLRNSVLQFVAQWKLSSDLRKK